MILIVLMILFLVQAAHSAELPQPPGQTGKIQVVESTEGYVHVNVSLTDISRISCPSAITNVVYSREKDIEVKTENRNLYVKILPVKKLEGKLSYDTKPRELFVTCGGEVFSLILIPQAIPSQTIVLNPKLEQVSDLEKKESSLPFEQAILGLIRDAYVERVPEGYTVKAVNVKLPFKELDLIFTKKYRGHRYTVEEYVIVAKQEIELYEPMFTEVAGANAVAISLVRGKLHPGEQTRMFIVRGSVHED